MMNFYLSSDHYLFYARGKNIQQAHGDGIASYCNSSVNDAGFAVFPLTPSMVTALLVFDQRIW